MAELPRSGADLLASAARADIVVPAPPRTRDPVLAVETPGEAASQAEPARCMVCGATPAILVTLRSVVAMVIFGVTSTHRGVYCRDCGLALFRQKMNQTLLTGWWGIIHSFINLFVVIGNLATRGSLMRLAPAVRDPSVGHLDPGRPVLLRAGFLVTVAVVAVVGGLYVSSALTPPKPFSAEDQATLGACALHDSTGWTEVDCSEVHSGKVVSLAHEGSACPSSDAVAKLPDGDFACIDSTK